MASLLSLMQNTTLLPKNRFDLLKRVAEISEAPTYAVGGFARDLLLQRRISDIDVVMEGNAISFARKLAKKFGGRVTAHEAFGTAKWILGDGSSLDLITARSETYKHPAALPTVKFASLSEDVERRDFTINTIAVRLDGDHFGELRDELHGQTDIENGIIRALHGESFTDDPTRMYRAVRYEQRYGFEIEERTLHLIPDARQFIEKLSAQRIRHELDLILSERNSLFMLSRLAELNLLKPIHPALPDEIPYLPILYQQDGGLSELWGVGTFMNEDGFFMPSHEFMWLVWLAPLAETDIKAIHKRLSFSGDLFKTLLATSSLLQSANAYVGARPSEWVKHLDTFPQQAAAAVYVLSEDFRVQDALHVYLNLWTRIKPATTGTILKKRGLAPGPQYNNILWKLRAAWLDGEINDKSQEADLLTRLLEAA